MPESSFADSPSPAAEVTRVAFAGMSRSAQAAMLLLNALPFCHVAAVVIGAAVVNGALARTAIVIGGIYLVPPLFVRLLLKLRPLRVGSYRLDAPEFFRWWTSAQGQILFCRFPFLEELLRLVPGLYSAWLRLWGAKIGRLTYWAPGVCILDRSLLEIGDDVIFGAGVRLNPHVIAEDENGDARLHLGPVRVGKGCRVGGYSLLTAGTVVEPGQTLKAFSLSPPFTTWRDGRRAKIAIPQ
jgi:hypothetical protein